MMEWNSVIGLRRTASRSSPFLDLSRKTKPSRRSARIVAVGLAFVVFVSPARQSLAAEDTAAPQLVEFSMSSAVVDTSDGSAIVTLMARITDDRAGFSFGNTTFSSPSGSQSLGAAFFATDRVSGTSLDGVYRRSVTIPRFSEQGVWTSNGFSLKDEANNLRDLSRSQLVAAGFPTSFEQTGAGETAAPQLVEFSMSSAVVDTSDGSAIVTLMARITDDRAGFSFGNTTFSSPSGSQSLGAAFFATDRVSGTSLDGVYRRSVTIPRFSEQGVWTSNGFSLKDEANNLRDLSRSQLVAAGFPTSFENGRWADLSITGLASPNPVLVGGLLVYTVGVANAGRSTATDVHVTDLLPAGASFVAANPSQGSCGRSAGVVTCSLGHLDAGEGATVTIKVTPTAKGAITNTAAVKSATVDPDPTNNSASVTTDVLILIGGAFGEHIDIDSPPRPVRFGPTPSVSLPPGGGEAEQRSNVRLQASPVIRTDALKVITKGGRSGNDIVVTSSAGMVETNIGDGIVMAKGIDSACRADIRGAGGSARIAELVILGRPVTVPLRPNMRINIPGVGVLLLNQQTTDALGVLTVNALHLKLNGGLLGAGDITLSQSRCGVES
jgi:uncharacterized repeat protein (TIGR01451 family)